MLIKKVLAVFRVVLSKCTQCLLALEHRKYLSDHGIILQKSA